MLLENSNEIFKAKITEFVKLTGYEKVCLHWFQ